jgi:hypothetical protein
MGASSHQMTVKAFWRSQQNGVITVMAKIKIPSLEVKRSPTKNTAFRDIVRTDVSKECVASIIRVTRIGELGTTLTTEARS